MKTAVVLFNLGGPEKQEDVRAFLFNLFKDKAILNVPMGLRFMLAFLIALRREKEARKIYAAIGGGSPLLSNTKAQANALKKQLGDGYSVFISMRYWHPMARQVARDVAAYAPDHIVYLPLYPQYSRTTTRSSFQEFEKQYPFPSIKKIDSYPALAGLVNAQADLIRPVYERVKHEAGKAPRLLFSAHGLPEKVVQAGDPYQEQVVETTRAVVAALAIPTLDWKNTFQSRVGPLKWIEPYTDVEIKQAGTERMPLVIVPISFVSEHSETLVEIDIHYRALAKKSGVPVFARVPAVGTHPEFIAGLAGLVKA